MKHLAVYVRVSKASQDQASQLPDLERWCKANQDGSAVVRWYQDKASGKTMERPAWLKLEKAIREGLVGTVLVWRLDRLGRTAKGLTALFDDLSTRKVNLVSLKDGLDLATPAGRLMANVLASVAQYETEVRAERVQAGLEVAKARGVKLGRKPVGEGNGKRLKVTDEQLALIQAETAKGTGVTALARMTGLSRPTIYALIP